MPSPPLTESKVVAVNQHPRGLGVKLIPRRGGQGRALLVIGDMYAASPLLASGQINVGDALVSLNGSTLINTSETETARVLSLARGSGQVRQTTVTLDLSDGSPGLSFVTDGLSRVRVGSVIQGSEAHHKGLREGVEVVKVNNQPCPSARDLKRLVMRLTRHAPTMSLEVLEGTVVLEVIPGSAVSREASLHSTPSMSTSRQQPQRQGSVSSIGSVSTRDPLANIDDLLTAVQAVRNPLTLQQQAEIRQLCQPDGHGMVTRYRFERAYNMVVPVDEPQTPSQPPSRSYSRQNSRTSFDSFDTPSTHRPMGSQSRSHAAAGRAAMPDEVQSLRKQLAAARETIERLQSEKGDAVTSQRYARAATQQSRQTEKDYDEIVALLEAEIAHLRAQLRAGPEEKDTQLINLRRRVLVLGVQLNKAVTGRRALEAALGKLRDFSDVSLFGLRNVECVRETQEWLSLSTLALLRMVKYTHPSLSSSSLTHSSLSNCTFPSPDSSPTLIIFSLPP
eukprot:m.146769 g.146769  ORF g.146769 m.146769 type:complete len:506 (-) comp16245_c0_seq13:704-2221(-)